MTEDDIRMSKRQIAEKYPKGSPDYPSHARHCPCSGCDASWLEWRSGHAAYALGIDAAVEACKRVVERCNAAGSAHTSGIAEMCAQEVRSLCGKDE